MLWWWLVGCGLTESGPTGMVGVLVGADGAPVVDQLVESLETQAHTAADGGFAVSFKEPNTEVHFQRERAFYQRRLLPADHGQKITLALPAERQLAVSCGARACDAALTWTLGDGYTARVVAPCRPDQTLALGPVPVGTPAVTCRTDLGAPEEAVEVEDRGGTLVFVPPPVNLEVTLDAGGATCEVRVDDRVVVPRPDGRWIAQIRGLVTVSAVCDGRPARPRLVAQNEGAVALKWSPDAAILTPRPTFSPVGEALLLADDEGWRVTLRAAADGSFALPPLDAGRYRLVFAPPEVREAALSAAPPPAEPGSLVVAEPAEGVFVGALTLTAPLPAGPVPVRR